MTPEWRDVVRAKMTDTSKVGDGVFRIAAHIRRGDVNPCRYPDRLSPNNLYLGLIEQYLPMPANQSMPVDVTIFSESDSYEHFDEFAKRNYTLHLNTDLATVWRTMMDADVLITAKSRFSLVPAILNPNTVVFNPLTYRKLPEWQEIDAALLQKSNEETEQLREEACASYSHRWERIRQSWADLRSGWRSMWKLGS